jgi:hypothetical protein
MTSKACLENGSSDIDSLLLVNILNQNTMPHLDQVPTPFLKDQFAPVNFYFFFSEDVFLALG